MNKIDFVNNGGIPSPMILLRNASSVFSGIGQFGGILIININSYKVNVLASE